MFTQTFIYTNTENDPDLVTLSEYAATDPTDTTPSGYANSYVVYGVGTRFLASSPGFVDYTVVENTAHRVSAVRVWDNEADRDTALVNFRANVNLYNAYSALLDRFRAHYNITSDPRPKEPPHYFP